MGCFSASIIPTSSICCLGDPIHTIVILLRRAGSLPSQERSQYLTGGKTGTGNHPAKSQPRARPLGNAAATPFQGPAAYTGQSAARSSPVPFPLLRLQPSLPPPTPSFFTLSPDSPRSSPTGCKIAHRLPRTFACFPCRPFVPVPVALVASTHASSSVRSSHQTLAVVKGTRPPQLPHLW